MFSFADSLTGWSTPSALALPGTYGAISMMPDLGAGDGAVMRLDEADCGRADGPLTRPPRTRPLVDLRRRADGGRAERRLAGLEVDCDRGDVAAAARAKDAGGRARRLGGDGAALAHRRQSQR